ncbi:hypothetical protein SM033_00016 [Vibrio phage vB_VpaM_sm033]|nr:hypothetical protein SM033_00016 [Vibrio phage vB_VpaM_sm033]
MAKSAPQLGFVRESEETLSHDITNRGATMRMHLAPLKNEGVPMKELFSHWDQHGNVALNGIALTVVNDDGKEELVSYVEMAPTQAIAILNMETKRNQNIKFLLGKEDQQKVFGRVLPGLNQLEVNVCIDEEKGIHGDYTLVNNGGFEAPSSLKFTDPANEKIRVYFGAISGKDDTLLNIFAINKAQNDKIDEARENPTEELEVDLNSTSPFGEYRKTSEVEYETVMAWRLTPAQLIEASMMGTINVIDKVPNWEHCDDLCITHACTFDGGGFTAKLRKTAIGRRNGWVVTEDTDKDDKIFGIGIDIHALSFDADKFDLNVVAFFNPTKDYSNLYDIVHVALTLEPKQNG